MKVSLNRMWPLLLAVAVLLVLGGVLVLLTHVEDWRRDLTQNYAETTASDPRRAPLETPLSPEELAARVRTAVARLPGWRLEPLEQMCGEERLHLVRSTRLMRYQDDIHVVIVATPQGSLLTASSRSRVGKGDLGQNPRNLRELLAAVRAEASAAQGPAGGASEKSSGERAR